MASKRKSANFSSPKAKKGMSSSSTVAMDEDYYANLTVDCIIEVCKHLDREWIDELSRANRNSYLASKAKCLDGIRLKGAELEIFKNSDGFCFTLTVTKKFPRQTGKRNVTKSEIYIYHIDDNGKKEKRIQKWKSEFGLDNARSWNEKKPTLDQAVPAKFFKSLKAIPDKYTLKSFSVRSVKIDAGFIEVLDDFIDPTTIEEFEYDKSCTIATDLTVDAFEKVFDWMNALPAKNAARISVMKNALNRAKAAASVAHTSQ